MTVHPFEFIVPSMIAQLRAKSWAFCCKKFTIHKYALNKINHVKVGRNNPFITNLITIIYKTFICVVGGWKYDYIYFIVI